MNRFYSIIQISPNPNAAYLRSVTVLFSTVSWAKLPLLLTPSTYLHVGKGTSSDAPNNSKLLDQQLPPNRHTAWVNHCINFIIKIGRASCRERV